MSTYIRNGEPVCRVEDLRLGQRVDLENDTIADPEGYAFARDGEGDGTLHPEFALEFQTVLDITLEGPECICVTFTSGFACGFPPDHVVEVDGEQ